MFTSSFWRINKIPFILSIVLVVVSLPFSPLFQGFGYDREIYRYIGMAITKGYLPYRDVFDHKPPGFYFIAAIAHLLGTWGFWIVSYVFTLIASFVVFNFARKYLTSYSFVLIVPLLYIFLSRYELIYEGGGLTREFTQVYATLFIFLRLQNQRLRFFVIGLLYSLIFFTQPNEILALTLIGAYYILWDSGEYKMKKIGTIFNHGIFFMSGVLLISATFCGYLFFNNIFDAFIEQAFLFNINFYGKLSFVNAIKSGWVILYEVFPNFMLFAVLYVLFAKKNKNFIDAGVFFSATFIQLYASSIGYHFGHYYLSFIPYFCYCVFFTLTHFENKLATGYHRIVATAAFFIFILPLTLLFQYKDIFAHRYKSHYAQKAKYLDKIKDIKGEDGQLFVFNNPPCLALNSELDCFSKCKLMYFHFYKNPKFDEDNKMFFDVIGSLQKNHCKYILDFSVDLPIEREELQNQWDMFVHSNYHVIYEEAGSYRLLQIN